MGLEAGGPADAAGLREGLPLHGWSVRYGDTSTPVSFVVEENGERRRVAYLPVGTERLAVPRYEAVAGCAGG